MRDPYFFPGATPLDRRVEEARVNLHIDPELAALNCLYTKREECLPKMTPADHALLDSVVEGILKNPRMFWPEA